MKKTFSILCLLSSILVGVSTPVQFTVQSLTGGANNRAITIHPDASTNAPAYGTNLVALFDFTIQPIAGQVTTNLIPWGYTFKLDGWAHSYHILVPDSATPINVINLISTNAMPVYPFTLNGTNLIDGTVNSNKFDAATRLMLGGSSLPGTVTNQSTGVQLTNGDYVGGTYSGDGSELIILDTSIYSVTGTLTVGGGGNFNSPGGVVIGNGATVNFTDGLAIGFAAATYGESGIALGYTASALGDHSVAISENAQAAGQECIAVGSSTAASDFAIAVGEGASADNSSIAIGVSANAGTIPAVNPADVGQRNISIGVLANSCPTGLFTNTVEIGPGNAVSNGWFHYRGHPIIDTSGKIPATVLSGTIPAASMPAFSGDITTTAGGVATTLKSTGTAGTYRGVTTDAAGRVTAGSNPTTFSGYAISDTSANLRAAVTDETGTGVAVFNNNATFTGTNTFNGGIKVSNEIDAGSLVVTGSVTAQSLAISGPGNVAINISSGGAGNFAYVVVGPGGGTGGEVGYAGVAGQFFTDAKQGDYVNKETTGNHAELLGSGSGHSTAQAYIGGFNFSFPSTNLLSISVTNSFFTAMAANQWSIQTSNYDAYLVTPFKTNLLSIGR